MTTRIWLAGAFAIVVFTLGCGHPDSPGLTAPSSLAAAHTDPIESSTRRSMARSAPRCMNVFAEGVAQLGFVEVAPGVTTLAGLPTTVTVGDIEGSFSSIVTSLSTSGRSGQGAQHITLQHRFESTDPAGSFVTEDKAVCAPAGTDENVCRVNDVMTVVSGTGVFANANGLLRNHGIADLNNNTLTFSVRGPVCGDGL